MKTEDNLYETLEKLTQSHFELEIILDTIIKIIEIEQKSLEIINPPNGE